MTCSKHLRENKQNNLDVVYKQTNVYNVFY